MTDLLLDGRGWILKRQGDPAHETSVIAIAISSPTCSGHATVRALTLTAGGVPVWGEPIQGWEYLERREIKP